MIPLRDEARTHSFPALTLLIILVNVGVFVYQLLIGPRGYENYIRAYGLIPIDLVGSRTGDLSFHVSEAPNLVASIFMHGGWGHLLGNMWFLWIFGDNIEDSLGHLRFLFFYLVVGVAATFAHVFATPTSSLPLVGASGAIAGVLGAYFLLFPFHRIVTLIPFFPFFTTARIPAAFFLGIWFVMQILYSKMGGNVAWWAHIGGFLAGMILILILVPRRKRG